MRWSKVKKFAAEKSSKDGPDISRNDRLSVYMFRLRILVCFLVVRVLVAVKTGWNKGIFDRQAHGGTQVASGDTILDSPPSIEPVQWVHDEEWFFKQAAKGCCPYAKLIYEERYANVDFRCCTSKLNTTMDPLRPTGGLDFQEYFQHWLRQSTADRQQRFQTANQTGTTSILIQGDSLAEQHFLAMVCFAWSSNLPVEMDADPKAWARARYVAKVDDSVTITFIRWNKPTIAPPALTGNLNEPDVVILGGWHHGGTEIANILRFLNEVQSQRGTVDKPTIIVESLPNHFPGGSYNANQMYPAAQVSHLQSNLASTTPEELVCDTTSLKGDPDINEEVGRLLENRTGFSILRVERLFHNRGDAHIGVIPAGTAGPQGRDCLHYCVAPGVLDAIAKQTLGNV